jgi:hypothetical protein
MGAEQSPAWATMKVSIGSKFEFIVLIASGIRMCQGMLASTMKFNVQTV